MPSPTLIAAALLAGLAVGAAACSSARPARPASAGMTSDATAMSGTHHTPSAPAGASLTPPLPGETRRVGGDMAATVIERSGTFRFGSLLIDTPLPAGYPAPTPPGSIDLKTYPVVRRAEYRAEGVGEGVGEGGMNRAFWPLFNHIKSRDIAMTSPVEMDYADVSGASDRTTRNWTMSFLYRYTDQGPTGEDGRVIVRDAPQVTVLAAGVKGDYGLSKATPAMEQIEAWLAANPQWKPAGAWRSLYYNGPQLRWWNKWGEVQIPVVPADAPAGASAAADAR